MMKNGCKIEEQNICNFIKLLINSKDYSKATEYLGKLKNSLSKDSERELKEIMDMDKENRKCNLN